MDLHARAGGVVFPSKAWQAISFVVNVLGIATTTHYLSRRIVKEKLSWSSLRQISWARLCVLLVFLDSWCFFLSAGVIMFGVGLESNDIVCAGGIDVCIAFYASSKIAVYFFLIERVYVVWSPTIGGKGRLGSRVYLICLFVIGCYSVVVILMIVGRLHLLRKGDGVCFMGLKTFASWAILSYDVSISVVLNLMFLWPLLKAQLSDERLKRLAIRTLVATAIALSTSSANTLAIAILKGREEGWICLGNCSLDIICNASAVFWITSGGSMGDESSNSRAPESRLESGRLTFNNRSNRNESDIEMPGRARVRTDISLNDFFRTDGHDNAKPTNVEIIVTTETATTREEILRPDFFSGDAVLPVKTSD